MIDFRTNNLKITLHSVNIWDFFKSLIKIQAFVHALLYAK